MSSYGRHTNKLEPVQLKDMICIDFGPYKFGFRIEEVRLHNFFEDKFRKHLTAGDPDLLFDVRFDDSRLNVPFNSFHPMDLNSISGNQFCFINDIIKGEFQSERHCHLSLKKEAFDYYQVCLFDVLLTRSFYYLECLNNPQSVSHLVVHASAVSRKRKGLIFTGPPESGKTTVASLLDNGKVLHDEAVLVSLTDRQVLSTPLMGKFPAYQNGQEDLNALFFLKQDNKVEVQEVSRFGAYNRLFRQIVIPLTLLDNDKRKGFEYIDKFCFEFVSNIPCYMLFFSKNNSFWPVIEEKISNVESIEAELLKYRP